MQERGCVWSPEMPHYGRIQNFVVMPICQNSDSTLCYGICGSEKPCSGANLPDLKVHLCYGVCGPVNQNFRPIQ